MVYRVAACVSPPGHTPIPGLVCPLFPGVGLLDSGPLTPRNKGQTRVKEARDSPVPLNGSSASRPR